MALPAPGRSPLNTIKQERSALGEVVAESVAVVAESVRRNALRFAPIFLFILECYAPFSIIYIETCCLKCEILLYTYCVCFDFCENNITMMKKELETV